MSDGIGDNTRREMIESAARALCRSQGVDPDVLQWGADPTHPTIGRGQVAWRWRIPNIEQRLALDAALASAKPQASDASAATEEALVAAYLRGAKWWRENGADSPEYVNKAARDYADATLGPPGTPTPFAWFRTDVYGRPSSFVATADAASVWEHQGYTLVPVYREPPASVDLQKEP